MTNPFHKHNCPICGKLTSGTTKEGGISWALCPECNARQNKEQKHTRSHRGETKGQHSA